MSSYAVAGFRCFPVSTIRCLPALQSAPIDVPALSEPDPLACLPSNPDLLLAEDIHSAAAIGLQPSGIPHRDPTGRRSLGPSNLNLPPLGHYQPLLSRPTASTPLGAPHP